MSRESFCHPWMGSGFPRRVQGSPGSFFTSPKAEAAGRERSREGNRNKRLSEMGQSELMQWQRDTLNPLGSTERPRLGLSISVGFCHCVLLERRGQSRDLLSWGNPVRAGTHPRQG